MSNLFKIWQTPRRLNYNRSNQPVKQLWVVSHSSALPKWATSEQQATPGKTAVRRRQQRTQHWLENRACNTGWVLQSSVSAAWGTLLRRRNCNTAALTSNSHLSINSWSKVKATASYSLSQLAATCLFPFHMHQAHFSRCQEISRGTHEYNTQFFSGPHFRSKTCILLLLYSTFHGRML